MKKAQTAWEYKKQNTRHARRSQNDKLRFKSYRRSKNAKEQFLPKKFRLAQNKYRQLYWDYIKIPAPKIFSLIKGDPTEVISFIDKIDSCFNTHKKVWIVLKNVEKLDHAAIVVLLSIMVRFKSEKIPFNGDFPINKEAKLLLQESEFFENLNRTFARQMEYEIKGNRIHTHGNKLVNAELTANIIEVAANNLWGSNRRCQGVQRTLLELMLNTNNHATPGKEGDRHWWLSVNHDNTNKIVSFSFVDYGVGIMASLASKKEGNKFHRAVEKLRELFNFKDNSELLRLILEGQLHKTVTGLSHRGKGLPGIFDALRRNSFNNLHVISNNVYANIDANEYKLLNLNFEGTFVYWELNNGNNSCDG